MIVLQGYSAMAELQIPRKLIDLTKLTINRVLCAVKIQNDISETFETKNGLRQGDVLACMLFNIALEKVIRMSRINTSGTIYLKSTQLMAYADDVDIVARSVIDAREAYSNLVDAAKRMGLQVKENKTLILVSTTSHRRVHNLGQNLTIEDHNLEVVHDFMYL